MKNKKEIEKILDYFNDKKLKILDEDTRFDIETYDRDEYNTKYYTAVTVEYIHKYVINYSIKLKHLKYLLMKLVYKGLINTFKCPDIEEIVFRPHYYKYTKLKSRKLFLKKYLYNNYKKYNILYIEQNFIRLTKKENTNYRLVVSV